MELQVNKNQFYIVSDNGQKLNVVPSFEKDDKTLKFLDGSKIIKIIKKQSTQTYKSKKDGKERHFYNYSIVFETHKSIQVKANDNDDLRVLDCISEYVK